MGRRSVPGCSLVVILLGCLAAVAHLESQPAGGAQVIPNSSQSAMSTNQTNRPTAVAANYDESKAGTYALPDPLVLLNGQPVTSAET
jgi:hypothetical protein